jgi:hypothetical protein
MAQPQMFYEVVMEYTIKTEVYGKMKDGKRTASMTFPLTFNAPVMKAFWPFNFPSAS